MHNNWQGGVWVCAFACVACTFPWCIAPLHAVTVLATAAGGEPQRQAFMLAVGHIVYLIPQEAGSRCIADFP
jgi:hypothetical protein